MTDPDTTAAWERVHAVIARLPGWSVTRTQYHAEAHRWHATAYAAWSRGHRAIHPSVSGTGETEAEALEALAQKLEGRSG